MKKRMILLAVVCLGVTVYMALLSIRTTEIEVTGHRLEAQRVVQTITCSGTITAGEVKSVTAPVGCVIDRMLVKEGQAVSAGDTIATIDKDESKRLQQERAIGAVLLAAMPTELRASVDGIVVSVTVDDGVWLDEGMPCVMIAEKSDIHVSVNIREKHLNSVKCGQVATVSGNGLRRDSYKGTLKEISSVVSNTNGSAVQGRVDLENGQVDDSFRLGLSAKVKLDVVLEEHGIVVPYNAVVEEDNNTFIYIAQGNKAIRREIQCVVQLQDGVMVDDLSLEGVVVITQPQAGISGQPVNVRPEVAKG